jgi:tetratricopeptide (TPR) repeat protein/predicted aspartyl protease
MLARVPCWLAFLLALPLTSAAVAADQCHILRSPPIPVTMMNREPVIPAKINGVDARFMVDTGSSFQILYPSAAAEFKLPLKLRPGSYSLGVGGYDNPDSTTVKTFTFGGTQTPDVAFLVTGNDLSQSGIAGLLGENLFQLWDEEFDFADGIMRLVQPQHCGGKIMAYWAAVNQAIGEVDLQRTFEKTDAYLIGTASVNGHSIRVLFDTGSERSMLSLAAARRAGISPNSPGVVAAGAAEGIGGQLVQTWVAPIAEFDIGGEQIRHTDVEIGQLDSRYYDSAEQYDMLLGADFFLAHHVYVANSQSKLYFTYVGGPVFEIISPKTALAGNASPGAPSDASASPSELMRRGMAAESRGLLDQAVADFTRACNLDPHNGDCFSQRGMARWRLRQPDLALQDFDTAIRLAPNDYETRFDRADLQIPRLHTAVKPDLDAVDRLAPQASNLRLELSGLYSAIHSYPMAIHEVTVWIGYHPDDVRLHLALNARCWFRAKANQDLNDALQDCNRALGLTVADANVLESRGLVYLRLGKPDKAIADYDASLEKNPQMAGSLFGRGLAELGRGDENHGRADIAAAEKIDPSISDFYAGIGLKP